MKNISSKNPEEEDISRFDLKPSMYADMQKNSVDSKQMNQLIILSNEVEQN